jgi:hypothetical protein
VPCNLAGIARLLVIFKGKTVQQQWFPTDLDPYKGWKFTAIANAWTNNEVAVEWLQKVFIPNIQPTDFSQKRLLLMDGHGSHITTEFMWQCFQNNILLLYLPPHCSHVLQPLDLGVFSSLKTTLIVSISSSTIGPTFLRTADKFTLTRLLVLSILQQNKLRGNLKTVLR